MTPRKNGLIVAISGYTGVTYTYSVVFGTAKSAVDRMARDMAIELEPFGVASISLWQGLTFTERAQRNLARTPSMTEQVVTDPAIGCSPEYPGRLITAELAGEYGVTDVDGREIPSLRAQRGAPIWAPIGRK
jgi:NAD(P)-dependent dehydrogenase (short-subunit alcohol dehydrogenase family)